MCSNLLECVRFESSRIATVIKENLCRIVNYWELISKVLITLTDKASNVTSEVEKILTLNEANGNVNNTVSELIRKIKNIVAHFKINSHATEKVLKMLLQMGSKSPLRLIQDINTMEIDVAHVQNYRRL